MDENQIYMFFTFLTFGICIGIARYLFRKKYKDQTLVEFTMFIVSIHVVIFTFIFLMFSTELSERITIISNLLGLCYGYYTGLGVANIVSILKENNFLKIRR